MAVTIVEVSEARELLARLWALGFLVRCEGTALRVWPRSRLTPELRALLGRLGPAMALVLAEAAQADAVRQGRSVDSAAEPCVMGSRSALQTPAVRGSQGAALSLALLLVPVATLAAAMGWPRVPLGSGVFVAEGAEAWQRFPASAADAELARAWQGLRGEEPRYPRVARDAAGPRRHVQPGVGACQMCGAHVDLACAPRYPGWLYYRCGCGHIGYLRLQPEGSDGNGG